MPITIDGTNGITQANEFNSDSSFAFKNRIINGDMTISQRSGTSSVTITSDGQYVIDRWISRNNVTSKVSIQQNAGSVTPPVGFTNYLGITSLSAYSSAAGDIFTINQRIEGFNTADFAWGTANAQAVTLSFWIRSSLTGTFGGSLTNSATSPSYVFQYTITSANTWEYKTVTIPGVTTGTWLATNGTGVQLSFDLGSGSNWNGTANTWQSGEYHRASGNQSVVGTNGATFYITGVQLEKGSTATSFDYLPYSTELALCQRYYYTTGNVANPTGTGGGGFFMPLAVALAFAQGNTSYKVTMRANPTITLYDGNGLAGTVTQHGVADAIPATAGGITANGFMQVQRTSGSFNGSAGYPVTGGYTASIEL